MDGCICLTSRAIILFPHLYAAIITLSKAFTSKRPAHLDRHIGKGVILAERLRFHFRHTSDERKTTGRGSHHCFMTCESVCDDMRGKWAKCRYPSRRSCNRPRLCRSCDHYTAIPRALLLGLALFSTASIELKKPLLPLFPPGIIAAAQSRNECSFNTIKRIISVCGRCQRKCSTKPKTYARVSLGVKRLEIRLVFYTSSLGLACFPAKSLGCDPTI
jgi:hypothetical protein